MKEKKLKHTCPVTTGWPPGLLQDDHSGLAKWFAGRLGAKHLVRENVEKIRKGKPK